MNGKAVILPPNKCSTQQLDLFCDVVLKGEQINTSIELLKENINNCFLLGFYEIGGQIAGVAALKIPRDGYKKRVFNKANVKNDESKFEYEIGYVVTLPNYRGQGISSILIEELIKDKMSLNCFATTKSNSMRKILPALNFHKYGESYLNDAKEILDLYVYYKVTT